MLLLSVAVVFFGLAWHSAASGGDDPEQKLAEAGAKMSATSASTSAPGRSSSGRGPALCVFNAGTVAGLASEVSSELEKKGFRVSDTGNLTTSSFTENTIFYDSGNKSAAQRASRALGGGASIEARPAAFSQCADGVPVIVVSR